MKVSPDWWKTMFDEIYLVTDARSVCNDDITCREVDIICEILPVRSGEKILDLCGGHGRHSLELCSRGFKGCTLLDYSGCLIDHARKKARECNLAVDCIQGDARSTQLPSESFDHVVIMGNSLGYLPDPAADGQILQEAKRVLRQGGWLLVDVTDGSKVKASLNPTTWHEIGADVVVCRERCLDGDTLCAREMVLSKQDGLVRDRTYAIRLYESQALESLMEGAGFRQVTIHTDFSPHQSQGDYGFMNHRMLAAGRKP